MRCIVFAYHDIGYACLESLLAQGAQVTSVFTHADDPNETVWFRSVRELAARHAIACHTPADVNTGEWIARLREQTPDFLFSFYYRKLLARPILEVPRHGALNLHGSLLPKYRGRCPVNWVLIHDEPETGVTLHYMEEKPDRGDIVAQRRVPILDSDTALSLFHKLTNAAAALIQETYPLLCAGTAPRSPQDHDEATYFGGRRPEDGQVAWNQSARQIFNLVRAVTHPYPGAFTTWQKHRFFLWDVRPSETMRRADAAPGTIVATKPDLIVQTGTGALRLQRVQLEGEAETGGTAWAQAHAIAEGATFS